MYFSVKLQGNRKDKKAVPAAPTPAGLMENWTLALGAWEPLSGVIRSECLLFPSLWSVLWSSGFLCLCPYSKGRVLVYVSLFRSSRKKNLAWLSSVHQGACSAQRSCQLPRRLLASQQIPAFSLGTHSWCDQVWPLQWGHVLWSCASQTLTWGPCETTGHGLVGLGWDMNFCRPQAPRW